jgi:DNA modification methylase
MSTALEWPADKVERRPLTAIIPAATNARTHSEAQIEQLCASMRQWGWTMPVLVDEAGELIAGHGRVMAAKRLGLLEVPVMTAAGWSEAQKRAYRLADNQLALNAGWDVKTLADELAGLKAWDFDLSLRGFDDLDALMRGRGGGLTDPDEAPAVPETPATQAGDVWLLDWHRLVCGDATVAADVKRAIAGAAPHLMVTDPPYGVEYDADWRNRAERANGLPSGGRAIGRVSNDHRTDWREAWALFPGVVCYCWHADPHASAVQASLEAQGFEIVCQVIWAKDRFVISRGDYHWQHEPCWYAARKGKRHEWSGDRSQSTLWNISHLKSETGHSAQKPVECMKRPIENNSSPGQAVYDPFVGSGTTIIAAEMTGRRCQAIEINPAYVDVAVKRWQEFTGKAAIHEGSGRTFDEIAGQQHEARQNVG